MTENELLSVTQIDFEFYQKNSVIVRKYDLLLGGDVKSQYLPCELNYSVVFCIIVALLLLAELLMSCSIFWITVITFSYEN